MKFLLRFLFFFLILLILVALGSLVLPSEDTYETECFIDASGDIVYEHINNINTWKNWYFLFANNSTTKWDKGEENTGIGASVNYKSEDPKIGSGIIKITDIAPGEFVETSITIENQSLYTLRFHLNDTAGGCKLTSSYRSSDIGFVQKYFVFLFGKENQQMLQTSAKNLTQEIDKAKFGRTGEFYVEKYPYYRMLRLRDSCSVNELSEKIEKMDRRYYWFFRYKKLEKPAENFIIYSNYTDTSNIVFSLAYPVVDEIRTYSNIKYAAIDSLKTATSLAYYGLPENMAIAYDKITTYTKEQNGDFEIWKIPVYNSTNEKDSTMWLTKFYISEIK